MRKFTVALALVVALFAAAILTLLSVGTADAQQAKTCSEAHKYCISRCQHGVCTSVCAETKLSCMATGCWQNAYTTSKLCGLGKS